MLTKYRVAKIVEMPYLYIHAYKILYLAVQINILYIIAFGESHRKGASGASPRDFLRGKYSINILSKGNAFQLALFFVHFCVFISLLQIQNV